MASTAGGGAWRSVLVAILRRIVVLLLTLRIVWVLLIVILLSRARILVRGVSVVLAANLAYFAVDCVVDLVVIVLCDVVHCSANEVGIREANDYT